MDRTAKSITLSTCPFRHISTLCTYTCEGSKLHSTTSHKQPDHLLLHCTTYVYSCTGYARLSMLYFCPCVVEAHAMALICFEQSSGKGQSTGRHFNLEVFVSHRTESLVLSSLRGDIYCTSCTSCPWCVV